MLPNSKRFKSIQSDDILNQVNKTLFISKI